MAGAYIVAATRTACGRRGGRLAGVHPADLMGMILDAIMRRTGADPAMIDDVIIGCVGQAGEQSANIARNAVLSSKLPDTVPAVSVDRQCGSSQQALHFAAQAVISGAMDVVIAGGVESMTRVPMGMPITLPAANNLGVPFGKAIHARYPGVGFSQFVGAEMVAKKYGLTKDELDLYGYTSQQRAAAATEAGAFKDEITPIAITTADGKDELHVIDEGIRFGATLEATKGVKLIQPDGGLLTAATSSQISDGAAAVMVVNEAGLKALGLEPLAQVRHMTVVGGDPVIMLEAPIPGTEKALKRAGMSLADIDLYEVNEAFASIPLAWAKALGADLERLNVSGGAIALGHPLGASGAKLTTTLVHALKARGKRWGLQTMCEGGGMANVTLIERL